MISTGTPTLSSSTGGRLNRVGFPRRNIIKSSRVNFCQHTPMEGYNILRTFENYKFLDIWATQTMSDVAPPEVVSDASLHSLVATCVRVLFQRELAKELLPNKSSYLSFYEEVSLPYDGIYYLQVQEILEYCRELILENPKLPVYITQVGIL